MALIVFDSEVMEKHGLAMWGSAAELCDYYDHLIESLKIGGPNEKITQQWEDEVWMLELMGHEYLFGV